MESDSRVTMATQRTERQEMDMEGIWRGQFAQIEKHRATTVPLWFGLHTYSVVQILTGPGNEEGF